MDPFGKHGATCEAIIDQLYPVLKTSSSSAVEDNSTTGGLLTEHSQHSFPVNQK